MFCPNKWPLSTLASKTQINPKEQGADKTFHIPFNHFSFSSLYNHSLQCISLGFYVIGQPNREYLWGKWFMKIWKVWLVFLFQLPCSVLCRFSFCFGKEFSFWEHLNTSVFKLCHSLFIWIRPVFWVGHSNSCIRFDLNEGCPNILSPWHAEEALTRTKGHHLF